ncbi:MAG: gliding motility-associated ABC transporter substrate-binding protein GldG [Chitinophagales bacterium]
MKLKKTISKYANLFILMAIILVVNFIGSKIYKRFDLTEEKRYSLSDPTKEFLRNLDDIVYVKVYLTGSLPSGMKELENSTRDILNECKAYGGSNIDFEFIDLTAYSLEAQEEEGKRLMEQGLNPISLTVVESGEQTQKVIFPGAIIEYKGRSKSLVLLENQVGYDQFEILNNSIALLEYKIANSIQKLQQLTPPKISFTQSNGELTQAEIGSILGTLQADYMEVASLNLNEGFKIDQSIDVVVIAKPTIPFDERQKFKLDQYVMNGGKILWFVDGMSASLDSIQGKDFHLAQPLDLNLDDILFKYGIRVNNDLIQDLQNTPIPLVTGEVGGVPQTQLFPWVFNPLLFTTNEHAITKNIDPVAGNFTNTLDTIRTEGIKKTILLTSSAYSRAQFAPVRVYLGIIKDNPPPEAFQQPYLPTAVALEGTFTSVFKNRITDKYLESIDTVEELSYREESMPTKMIVVSDGDIIRNQVSSTGNPLPLGFDRYSQSTYGNKTFVKNCIEYLIDDYNLIETRNKEIKLRQLDGIKLQNERTFWQVLNIALPLALVFIFGLIFSLVRKRKYAR